MGTNRDIFTERRINKKGFSVPVWRCVSCRRFLAPSKDEYEIRVTNDKKNSFLGNVAVCGSVHICPVCAYVIGQKRGKELSEAIENKGCGQGFMVVTIRHKRDSILDQLYLDLSDAVRFMFSGAPYGRFKKKWDIKGTVNGWENTFSLLNGHHPHKNLLFLSEHESLDCQEFRDDLYKISERYLGILEKSGYYTNEHTVKVLTDKDDCAKYMTKWALSLETAGGAKKEAKEGHFTTFELLREIEFGDLDPWTKQEYINLYVEFAIASKGKKQLFYSRGLREWLGLGKDKTDQELADEGSEKNWFVFVGLGREHFKKILAFEKAGSVARCIIAAREFSKANDYAGFWEWADKEFGIVPDAKTLSTRSKMPL